MKRSSTGISSDKLKECRTVNILNAHHAGITPLKRIDFIIAKVIIEPKHSRQTPRYQIQTLLHLGGKPNSIELLAARASTDSSMLLAAFMQVRSDLGIHHHGEIFPIIRTNPRLPFVFREPEFQPNTVRISAEIQRAVELASVA